MPIPVKTYFKKVEEMTTYKINRVEIFSAGRWNEDDYEVKDLHSIRDAFNSLRAGFIPYLKLGHDNDQSLAMSSGLPSVGWVEELYVEGDKLLADLNYIPEKVYKLIHSKAYRKVSCEIYWNLEIDGKTYPRVLGGIAFLGAENPGVANLDDILGNYSFAVPGNLKSFASFEKESSFKTYNFNYNPNWGDKMPEDQQKELEAKLDEARKDFAKSEDEKKKLLQEKESRDKDFEELRTFKLQAEEREAKARQEAVEAKKSQFITELESKKLVTPAMKPLVSELMGDKKEYTIEKKTYTKEALVEEILKLAVEASKVNFDEKTRADYEKKSEVDKDEEKIQKYMDDHKCSYVQAYKAVMKEKQ
jgi:hypothetical protein